MATGAGVCERQGFQWACLETESRCDVDVAMAGGIESRCPSQLRQPSPTTCQSTTADHSHKPTQQQTPHKPTIHSLHELHIDDR